MTVGEDFEASEKILVHKMQVWESQLIDANTILTERVRDKDKVEDEKLKELLNAVDLARGKVDATRKDITLAENNLGRIVELFNARKASHEVTKSVIEAWPPRRFSERLLWIGYALIPAGGVQLAFLDELSTTVVMWGLGAYLVGIALADIWRHDNDKLRYFKREVGIEDSGSIVRFAKLLTGRSSEHKPPSQETLEPQKAIRE